MTLISKCILAGYAALHIIFILLLDRTLKKGMKKGENYPRLRWVWILPFSVFVMIPVLATLIPENAVSLFLERIGNAFLAFDMHIAGVWFLTWIISLIVWKKDRKRAHPQAGIIALIIALVVGTAVPIYGMFHANDPKVRYETADLRNGANEGRMLRVALIADFHLSVNAHLSTTQKMVQRLNAEEPDLVVIAGDIFTSSYRGLRNAEAYADTLAQIEAPLGVYAVYGNHDLQEKLFAGFAVRPVAEAFRPKEMDAFFERSGFTMLADQTVSIADGALTLAGRNSESKAGDGTDDRLTPAQLLAGLDEETPILVIEHEPVEYAELAAAGADMVVSGHTHNGQIFPGNIYVKFTNQNSYGKKSFAGMETFVTSGVGTFGPPMRTGTNSEIMIIDVQL